MIAKKLDLLIDILSQLLSLAQKLVSYDNGGHNGKIPDSMLMTKQEVLAYLNISDSTYKRRVREGLLKPMRLGGGDVFYKEDLQQALWESKRKGKI
ncbi:MULTISPECIES: helix-turn-helix transcriptional regulator [Olivibacter]|uniref:Helix-turn-helix transcriptional regulator n=1 Tax=Olivibacter jilunii TaxID=985016 RepID=A0ABW6B2E4_9SPHI